MGRLEGDITVKKNCREVYGYLMDLHLPAAIFWIAVVLYVINAGMVLTIRQATAPRAVAAEKPG